jgi:hypothetical protein
MNNEELLDKLREGIGSLKLDNEVAKALWLEEQLSGVSLDVTTSLDATESRMQEKLRKVDEFWERWNDDNWWAINAVAEWQDEKGRTWYRPVHSSRITGPDAHACARCIVLLKALPDGEYK